MITAKEAYYYNKNLITAKEVDYQKITNIKWKEAGYENNKLATKIRRYLLVVGSFL